MAFAILVVCTGNICRSPMGERLLFARTRDARVDVRTFSAGTHAVVGYPMDAPSADVLRELGGDPSGHAARLLIRADLEADLVLTATTEQRAFATRLAPDATDRVFTLREFARLLDGLDGLDDPDEQTLGDRVRAVAGRRSDLRDTRIDDISDPFGAADGETRRVGRQVSDAVDVLLRGFGLSR